jgi:hypothetical protein
MMAILRQRARPAWLEIAGLLKGAAVEWFRPRQTRAAAAAPVSELAVAQARVDTLVKRIVDAIAHHQFETARVCCREETQAREQLRTLREKYNVQRGPDRTENFARALRARYDLEP